MSFPVARTAKPITNIVLFLYTNNLCALFFRILMQYHIYCNKTTLSHIQIDKTEQVTQTKKQPEKTRAVISYERVNYFLTLSTIALKAAGLFIARSARTLRLISMPALCNAPINCE